MSDTGALPRARWVPLALLAVVVALDLVIASVPFHVLSGGLLDEPCHLATAALALLALPRLAPDRRAAGLVLLAAVGIDLDHVPLYLGVPHVDAGGGRPFTHSLLTVAVLLVLAATPRLRAVCLPLALGVALHFLRDVATGPGLHLWWPASGTNVLVPYPAYVAVLVVLAVVATLRCARPATRVRQGA